MKSYLLFISILTYLLFSNSNAYAFKIKIDLPAIADKSLREMDSYFAQNGYEIYKNENDFFPQVDRLYAKDKFKEKVFVKVGAYVEEKTYNKLLSYRKGYLSNLIINGKSNVIYLSGFNVEKAIELKSNLNWVFRARSTWSALFLPSAEAARADCKASPNQEISLIDSSDFRRQAIHCVIHAAQTNENLNKLTNCISTKLVSEGSSECLTWSDRIFSQAEINFENTTEIATLFGDAFLKSIPSFAMFHAERKAKLVCELISLVGLPTAMTMATGSGSYLFFQRALAKLPLSLFKSEPDLVSNLKSVPQVPDGFRSELNNIEPNLVKELTTINLALISAKESAIAAYKNLNAKPKRAVASIESTAAHEKLLKIYKETVAGENKVKEIFINKYSELEKKIKTSNASTTAKSKLLSWTTTMACPIDAAAN